MCSFQEITHDAVDDGVLDKRGQCLREGWIRCLYSPKVVKLPLGLPIELSPAGFNKREGIVKETELALFTFGALKEETPRLFVLVVKKTVSQ